MELYRRYVSKSAAELDMLSIDVRPGTLVAWDKGASSRDPARSRDWPGLVIKIEVAAVETYDKRWHEIMVTVVTPERRIRRYNARCIKRHR